MNVPEYYEFLGSEYSLANRVPTADQEADFIISRQATLALAKSGSGYTQDRDYQTIEWLHGLDNDDFSLHYKLLGKKVADICAGSSSFAETCRKLLMADSYVFDISQEKLAENPITVDKKALLDITKPLPEELIGKFEVTFCNYGQPFWALTITGARNAIKNQIKMTDQGGLIVNGPIVAVQDETKDIKWSSFSPAEMYGLMMDYAVLDEVFQSLGSGIISSAAFNSRPEGNFQNCYSYSLVATKSQVFV